MGHCAWVWMPLAWVAGVVVQLQQPVRGRWAFTCFCGLAVALVALSAAVVQWGLQLLVARAGDGVPVGGGWSGCGVAGCGHHRVAGAPPGAGAGCTVAGPDLAADRPVDDLPRRTPWGWRFLCRWSRCGPLPAQATAAGTRTPSAARWQAPVATPAAGLPGRVTLAGLAQDGGAVPQAGERWQLAVRLRQPHGLANPTVLTLNCGCGARGWVPPARCA